MLLRMVEIMYNEAERELERRLLSNDFEELFNPNDICRTEAIKDMQRTLRYALVWRGGLLPEEVAKLTNAEVIYYNACITEYYMTEDRRPTLQEMQHACANKTIKIKIQVIQSREV